MLQAAIHIASPHPPRQTNHRLCESPREKLYSLSWTCFAYLWSMLDAAVVVSVQNQHTGIESFYAILSANATLLHTSPTLGLVLLSL
jgi:hypothetical protein